MIQEAIKEMLYDTFEVKPFKRRDSIIVDAHRYFCGCQRMIKTFAMDVEMPYPDFKLASKFFKISVRKLARIIEANMSKGRTTTITCDQYMKIL